MDILPANKNSHVRSGHGSLCYMKLSGLTSFIEGTCEFQILLKFTFPDEQWIFMSAVPFPPM